ncbi:MAG: polysaccharide biosynthesis tyrosine autokinase [Pseudomonadota bacterium]
MLKRNSEFVEDEYYYNQVHSDFNDKISAEFLDLHTLFQILARRFRLIVICVLAILCLSVLYLITATPKYTSQTLILIDPREQKVLSSDAVVSGLGTESSAVESEVEIIKSRAIANRVIKKLDLANAAKTASVLSALKSLVFTSVATPEDREKKELIAQEKLLEGFSKNLSVKRKGLTYIIAVGYTSSDPQQSADIANAVGDAYLNEQLEAKFNITRRASVWLEQKLAELRDKVRVSEKRVELYKVENNLVEAGGKTLSEQQIAQLNTQLIDARAKTAGSFAKYQQARQMSKRGGQLASVADALQSVVISGLRKQLAEVGRKEAELKSRYGPKHPTVINIQAEKRDISKQIRGEVARIIANLRNEYEVSKSQEDSLKNSLEELKQQNSIKNAASIKLRELQRIAQAERAAFNALLGRFKETSAQESLQTADARIISEATPAIKPSSPKKFLMIIGGIFVGIFVGISFAFLKEYFDNVLRSSSEVEQHIGVPHLASIPLVDDDKAKTSSNSLRRFFSVFKSHSKKTTTVKNGVGTPVNRIVIDTPLSGYSEAIRSLHITARLNQLGPSSKIIMVTSALPNEGKTTTSLNLAQYAALSGERTLLIDADVRNPSLTAQYCANTSQGLLNILEGSVGFAETCIKDSETNLDFLPNTNRAQLQQPSEILGSEPMISLINDLRGSYDLIIIDVAPLLPVVDAQVLLPHIDKAVMVTEWGATSRNSVLTALKPFRHYREKLLGIVLNKAIQEQMKYYEPYGGSGYYNQYGYGAEKA